MILKHFIPFDAIKIHDGPGVRIGDPMDIAAPIVSTLNEAFVEHECTALLFLFPPSRP